MIESLSDTIESKEVEKEKAAEEQALEDIEISLVANLMPPWWCLVN
jgi:hypothetical protein